MSIECQEQHFFLFPIYTTMLNVLALVLNSIFSSKKNLLCHVGQNCSKSIVTCIPDVGPIPGDGGPTAVVVEEAASSEPLGAGTRDDATSRVTSRLGVLAHEW